MCLLLTGEWNERKDLFVSIGSSIENVHDDLF